MRILIHRCTQTGHYFPKSGHFFTKSGHFFSTFKKGQGRPPPPPSPLVARLLEVFYKKMFLTIRKIRKKTLVSESLFKRSFSPEECNFIKKETHTLVFSCEIFKNTYFEVYKGLLLNWLVSRSEHDESNWHGLSL